jgi:phage repressor protein C with HTH and peptisase S24 domain
MVPFLKQFALLPDLSSGSMIETKPRGIPLVFESDKEFEDGIVIPVLGDNPVSAGRGEGIGDGELPTRYIHAPKELGKYPPLMSLPVRGDSMSPTLSDGDMVVCDGGGWDGDGIYVIKTIDETFVKRVQHTPQGYRIVSDNKLYESYNAGAEEIAIVGRVRAMVVMVPGRRGGV